MMKHLLFTLLHIYDIFIRIYHFLKHFLLIPFENKIIFIENFDMDFNNTYITNAFINFEFNNNSLKVHQKRNLHLTNTVFVKNYKIHNVILKNVNIDQINFLVKNMNLIEKETFKKKYLFATLNNEDITQDFINKCWALESDEIYVHELSLILNKNIDSKLELTDSDTLDISIIEADQLLKLN